MKQPSFDGEFYIFIIFTIMGITGIIYLISYYRVWRRQKTLREEVDAFNKLAVEQKFGHAAMDKYRVGSDDKFIDFYMRMHDTPEANVYRHMPTIAKKELIYMEILILDEHKIVIKSSKVFSFYYINSSWEESMQYFFRCYCQCLAYYRLCDAWDTTHFYVRPSDIAAEIIRRYTLSLRVPTQF